MKITDVPGIQGHHILLGVTGGVAAYKSVELARLLVKAGAEVRVVMTKSATRFIGPLTFQAITGNPVRSELFDEAHEAAMGHIELARWADLILIAPATANFIARLVHGFAEDLLNTLCLAAHAPLLVAPAMNQQMWRNAATVSNVSLLLQRGVRMLGPASGDQACGDNGPGRMLEADELFQAIENQLTGGRLNNMRALVTAGPTREAVDPVRFLGNRSSGKMGFAVADALAREGAEVILVSGPVTLETPRGVTRIDVESAADMYQAVMSRLKDCDLFVASAAVADYRPAVAMDNKIKKNESTMELSLVRNPDILASVAALDDAPFTVGFAAETESLVVNAELKRQAKGVDMIAANLVGEGRLGFDTDNNTLLVSWEGGSKQLPVESKGRLARRLVALVADRIHAKTTTENTG